MFEIQLNWLNPKSKYQFILKHWFVYGAVDYKFIQLFVLHWSCDIFGKCVVAVAKEQNKPSKCYKKKYKGRVKKK